MSFKTYYRIDANDPPSIEDISRAWSQEHKCVRTDVGVRMDSGATYQANLRLSDLMKFREYRWDAKNNRGYDNEKWTEFVSSIKNEGLREPVMLMFGRDCKVRLGEGNHRIAALKQIIDEAGIKKVGYENVVVPTSFIFWENCSYGIEVK